MDWPMQISLPLRTYIGNIAAEPIVGVSGNYAGAAAHAADMSHATSSTPCRAGLTGAVLTARPRPSGAAPLFRG